jgi:hypothetical protein
MCWPLPILIITTSALRTFGLAFPGERTELRRLRRSATRTQTSFRSLLALFQRSLAHHTLNVKIASAEVGEMDGVETCACCSASILDLGIIVGAEVIFVYEPTPIVLVGRNCSVCSDNGCDGAEEKRDDEEKRESESNGASHGDDHTQLCA